MNLTSTVVKESEYDRFDGRIWNQNFEKDILGTNSKRWILNTSLKKEFWIQTWKENFECKFEDIILNTNSKWEIWIQLQRENFECKF